MKTELNTNTKRRTNSTIQNAYIDLLSEMPAEQITVRMICEAAHINRTTFYNYYEDIIDLRDSVSDRLFDTLFTNVMQHAAAAAGRSDNSVYVYMKEALDIIRSESRSYKAMLCNNTSHVFTDRLYLACIQAMSASAHKTKDKTGAENIALLSIDYMIYGIIGSVQHWLADDCRVPTEEMADMLDQSMRSTFAIMAQY